MKQWQNANQRPSSLGIHRIPLVTPRPRDYAPPARQVTNARARGAANVVIPSGSVRCRLSADREGLRRRVSSRHAPRPMLSPI